jgi:transcriptional regulator with XRE-family HTH domain
MTLTSLVAKRIQTLRTAARLSGAALAAALREHGVPWTRVTVAKLETGKRQLVSLTEWLALAEALHVPPAWLLVDLKSGAPVPLADGREIDPWNAVLWITGQQPLDPSEPPTAEWTEAAATLGLLCQVVHALTSYRLADEMTDDPTFRDTLHRRILDELSSRLDQLATRGYPLPPLPHDVIKCAEDLGILFPGQAV